MNKPIKVAYVFAGDAKDVHQWSGTTSFVANALQKQGIEVYYIDNLNDKRNFFVLVFGKIYSKILNALGRKKYIYNITIKISKKFAKEIEKRLTEDTDIIFAPSGVLTMAFVNSKCKKVMYNDATFALLQNYYPFWTNLCNRTLQESEIMEKKALENCDLLLYSSNWAVQSAINDYKIDAAKIKAIPFGANIEKEYSESEIREIIQNRNFDKCKLLFVGVDWERKGGNIAVSVAKELKKKNIPVELNLVGINNISEELPEYVINHGFISKRSEEGIVKLENMFKEAHFFILPTRNECSSISLCEASSFGLPALSTYTGGTSEIIINGKNGWVFDLDSNPQEYADYIEKLWNNREEYKKLCFSSYNEYKTRLNWTTAGESIAKAIKELLCE